MQKQTLIVVAMVASCTAAFGQNNIDSTPVTKPVMLEDGRIVQMVVPAKQPFTVRHPKLHKVGRKIRKTCQVLLPVVQFAGSTAQVARMFY